MSSTFGSLTTVKLGIYAAQKGLDVTGNNITCLLYTSDAADD